MPAAASFPGEHRAALLRLIVTRPAAEAQAWVGALMARGWPAQALPLIEIGEPRSPEARAALTRARQHWLEQDALMFVSGAAVTRFFADGVAAPDHAEQVKTRFWAPGPGTARALASALAQRGLTGDRIDSPPDDAEQFDSEALWPVIREQVHAGRRVLVVRGTSEASVAPTASPSAQPGHGRDWLIRQCEAAGASVRACVAYERRAPTWGEAQRSQATAATEPGSVWLFSSSEALAHLQQGLSNPVWSRASALVTHPRIAQAARHAGFKSVQETRPALDDVVRALELHWSRP